MKVVLDIDKLLLDKDITESEYARLKALAAKDTGSLAFNILIGFGVIATAAGALALLRSAPASIVLGVALSLAGVTLRARLKPNPSLRNACTSAAEAGTFETVVPTPFRSSRQTAARVATGAGAVGAGHSPGYWTTNFSSPFASKVGDRPASSGKWVTAVVSNRTRPGRPHTRNSGLSCT